MIKKKKKQSSVLSVVSIFSLLYIFFIKERKMKNEGQLSNILTSKDDSNQRNQLHEKKWTRIWLLLYRGQQNMK